MMDGRDREYHRLLEILNDYWLSVPDEKKVTIEMCFEKANGEKQIKTITWKNPNLKGE